MSLSQFFSISYTNRILLWRIGASSKKPFPTSPGIQRKLLDTKIPSFFDSNNPSSQKTSKEISHVKCFFFTFSCLWIWTWYGTSETALWIEHEFHNRHDVFLLFFSSKSTQVTNHEFICSDNFSLLLV